VNAYITFSLKRCAIDQWFQGPLPSLTTMDAHPPGPNVTRVACDAARAVAQNIRAFEVKLLLLISPNINN
jgi:hypothetical protein